MKDALHVRKKQGLPDCTLTTAIDSPAPWSEYPRPGMVRSSWTNLNGQWEYAITETEQEPEHWDGLIRVPFSPEAPLSGVRRQLLPSQYLWYRLSLPQIRLERGECLLLNFGAVDQECSVRLNGQEVARHSGGYLPFTADLTAAWRAGDNTLTVMVTDATEHSWQARGKQRLKRGGMYYTAQSGIWQTVWLEKVPAEHITGVDILPLYDEAKVRVTVRQTGAGRVRCTIREESPEMAAWRDHPERGNAPQSAVLSSAEAKQGEAILELPDFMPWTPETPSLYRLTVEAGEDRVECCFGMRVLTKENGRLCLNHRPCVQVGVLDQGYWPDGLYTAPCDEALIHDISTMKSLGYNLLRKHIKIEPERWYYHCDRLGMLVWQDMVSGGSAARDWFVTYLGTALNTWHITLPDGPGFRWLFSRTSREGREQWLRELKEMVDLLRNHPCVAAWVPFNEGWGQFDAAAAARKLRSWDDSRWIDHASGWFDRGEGDIISLHHYFFKFHPPKKEKHRVPCLTEFGGYTWQVPGHLFSEQLYGYGGCADREELSRAYEKRWMECVPLAKEGYCAFIYTQLSDIEEETNGILTYDRAVIKPDAETVRRCCRLIREAGEQEK